MEDDNKLNIFYFENNTMPGLYNDMDTWQKENRKRFLSASIEKDGENFCCIALCNPSEVVIVGPYKAGSRMPRTEYRPARVNTDGQLKVTTSS